MIEIEKRPGQTVQTYGPTSIVTNATPEDEDDKEIEGPETVEGEVVRDETGD